MVSITVVALVAASLVSIEALSSVQDVNSTAPLVKPHGVAALQKHSIPKQRGEGNKFLDKRELSAIPTVRCLQEKQRHPNRPCSDPRDGKRFYGDINMGHFPNWRDEVCHSNQEFFCDAESLMKIPEQTVAQVRLQEFKERNMVNCGAFSKKQDPHSKWWYDQENKQHNGRLGLEDHRPFNLAVVVADEWPQNEMDPKSIDYFGRVIMSQWGLQPIYNGVDNGNGVNEVYQFDQYTENCPNTAVLFILPKFHEAYISSPSCEFLCASRGGPEVIAAILAGLDRGGLQEAVMSGIDQIEKVLNVTLPLSVQQAPVQKLFNSGKSDELAKSDAFWVWAMRFAYAFVVIIALLSVGAFLYYVALPQKPASLRSISSMQGVNGRKTLQEHFAQGQ